MKQLQKHAKTCGNCVSSKLTTPHIYVDYDPVGLELGCLKNLPSPDALHHMDDNASTCEGWEAKYSTKSWTFAK